MKGLVAALTAVLMVAFVPGASQAQTEDVGIMAAHKSPFNCGKTFYATNLAYFLARYTGPALIDRLAELRQ